MYRATTHDRLKTTPGACRVVLNRFFWQVNAQCAAPEKLVYKIPLLSVPVPLQAEAKRAEIFHSANKSRAEWCATV